MRHGGPQAKYTPTLICLLRETFEILARAIYQLTIEQEDLKAGTGGPEIETRGLEVRTRGQIVPIVVVEDLEVCCVDEKAQNCLRRDCKLNKRIQQQKKDNSHMYIQTRLYQ